MSYLRKFKRYFTSNPDYMLTDLNRYCTVCGWMKTANGINDYGMPVNLRCTNGDYHHGLEKNGIAATLEAPVTARTCPVCLWRNWHDAHHCGKCGYELQKDNA
jgi:hypothetical protein